MHRARLLIPLLILVSASTTVRVGRGFDLAAFDARVQRGVPTGIVLDALLLPWEWKVAA